ncbi:hypothetical protein F5X68DRAFT_33784 [Plectosphaerella plurivora]|uniref:Uncharacterized protein n=1 Tax=Plectosphaerella plurivora TaxID=936078 RepID=A0A9P8V6Z3_9PEZI|nr:hypothetical protein F5X68DRAFT_33784 [Plectosphaerella plurivora]
MSTILSRQPPSHVDHPLESIIHPSRSSTRVNHPLVLTILPPRPSSHTDNPTTSPILITRWSSSGCPARSRCLSPTCPGPSLQPTAPSTSCRLRQTQPPRKSLSRSESLSQPTSALSASKSTTAITAPLSWPKETSPGVKLSTAVSKVLWKHAKLAKCSTLPRLPTRWTTRPERSKGSNGPLSTGTPTCGRHRPAPSRNKKTNSRPTRQSSTSSLRVAGRCTRISAKADVPATTTPTANARTSPFASLKRSMPATSRRLRRAKGSLRETRRGGSGLWIGSPTKAPSHLGRSDTDTDTA